MPRPTLLAILLVLAALPAAADESDVCDELEHADYVAGPNRVRYASHECSWHDLRLQARIVERVERYDGYNVEVVGGNPGHERLVFTWLTIETETRYYDGRLKYQHRTDLYVGGASLRHDYNEDRDREGTQSCRGAAEFRPGWVPGQVLVPTTPKYPKCAPPGLLV